MFVEDIKSIMLYVLYKFLGLLLNSKVICLFLKIC